MQDKASFWTKSWSPDESIIVLSIKSTNLNSIRLAHPLLAEVFEQFISFKPFSHRQGSKSNLLIRIYLNSSLLNFRISYKSISTDGQLQLKDKTWNYYSFLLFYLGTV